MSVRSSRQVRSLAAAATAALAAACAQDQPAPLQPSPGDGPSLAAVASEGRAIPGRFIVQLEPRANPREVARAYGIQPDYVYETAVVGFAGSISEAARAGLLRDNRIVRVEQDQVVTKSTTQSNATWGLDRIDARTGLDGSYTYNTTAGNVTAYIIDTGIRTSHVEFGGRAVAGSQGFDAFGDGQNGQDCDGHGTHVAGTVGGATYGVAKGVRLVAVRVLDCGGSGTISGVVAGVDWVAQNASGPSVANMSLGGGASSTLDAAVDQLVQAGVTTVVAAGNSNTDACRSSPARVASAITVGATTNTDARASYSNYGSCLDLFAPGSAIVSAWFDGDTRLASLSGTSMASPHVAGVAALHLAGNTGASPAAVASAITSSATPNAVGSAGRNSPNLLLYSLLTAPTTEPPADGGGGTCKNPKRC